MASFFPKFERCPICGSDRLRPALTIHYWRENPLAFDDCEACHACFANPMPGDALISRGNDALVRWYQRDRTFAHEFRDARQAYLRGKLLAKKLSRWKEHGRLLDLGCYNGFLPLGVRDTSDWQVEGVEISGTLARFIQEHLALTCHQGTLEELRLPSDHYDFILCHDLIEHINQPQPFLAELARVMKPGGRLQIITPNAVQDLAYAKRAQAQGIPFGMLLNHILYFSTQALRHAVESVGLRVRRLYTYDIRHTPKDLGWFGLGAPRPQTVENFPSIQSALAYQEKDLLSEWTSERIEELRHHPRVSLRYGFFRETLPRALTLRVPESVGLGHEIYALVEKP